MGDGGRNVLEVARPTLGVGVDGAAGGWVYVAIGATECRFGCVKHIAELYATLPTKADVCVFIDMPIGLSDDTGNPRSCESIARRLLGPRRASVFPVPARRTLAARDYVDACALNQAALNKSLSRQSYGILPKIRELDEVLTSDSHARAMTFEAHPELCFWALAGGTPLADAKKTKLGQQARLDLLQSKWSLATATFELIRSWAKGRRIASDDIVDAMVNALAAAQASPSIRRIPVAPSTDSRGLVMQIHYSDFGYDLPRDSAK